MSLKTDEKLKEGLSKWDEVNKDLINGLKIYANEFKTHYEFIEYYFLNVNIKINGAYIDKLEHVSIDNNHIIINSNIIIKTWEINDVYMNDKLIYENDEDKVGW